MLSTKAQQSTNSIIHGGIIVVVFMFIMGMTAITSSKTQDVIEADANCVNTTGITFAEGSPRADAIVNCTVSNIASLRGTFDRIEDGTADGADMGKIALFAIPAIFVLGLFIGLGRLA